MPSKIKNKTVTLHITETEYEKILEDANRVGLSISSYLKQIVFTYTDFAEQLSNFQYRLDQVKDNTDYVKSKIDTLPSDIIKSNNSELTPFLTRILRLLAYTKMEVEEVAKQPNLDMKKFNENVKSKVKEFSDKEQAKGKIVIDIRELQELS